MSALAYFADDELTPTLRHRIKQLPPHSQERLSYLATLRLQDMAKHEADLAFRRKLMDERDRAQDQIDHIARQEKFGHRHDPDSKKVLNNFIAERDAAVAELKKFGDAKTEKRSSNLSRDQRKRLSVLARFKPSLVDWLLEQPSGQKWKKCVPDIKAGNLIEALERNRAAQGDFADEIIRAEAAPLDLETVLRKINNEVAALAASGIPDISQIFKLVRPVPSVEKTAQGGIKWPETSLSPLTHKPLQNGNALVAWLFKDALVAKLQTEAKARFNAAESLTGEERLVKVKECEGHILALLREEAQIVLALEKQGMTNVRGSTHPLALLGIEPV